MSQKITAEHLSRIGAVYVRQSTMTQVKENLESQRRQYELADLARKLGFQEVIVIDEDLGSSGSGMVERPGFQRLVAEVCTSKVGAVFCIEASRLARNGRDWHHLLELCGLTSTLIIDPDGVYDPCQSNDRLLLGFKGTMSEFELRLLRQRSREAVRAKAKRGELRILLPAGLVWTRSGRVEIDPDRRVQDAIRRVFQKFTELRSARQTTFWLRDHQVSVPAMGVGEEGQEVQWRLPTCGRVLGIIGNPQYAGAYAYGRTGSRVKIEDGRPRKTLGHSKPREEWDVLILDHHPGYISWDAFERNQKILSENAHMRKPGRKAGRGGRALLVGLLRCRRCGRRLEVSYRASDGTPRYRCRGAGRQMDDRCISFGGVRPDRAVAAAILEAVEEPALEAALQACDRAKEQEKDRMKALDLELERAQYEIRLAARRYESVDPDNRLVAAELEARWNEALELEVELAKRKEAIQKAPAAVVPDRKALLSLATELPAVWDAPSTDRRLKQRIVAILVQEIIADVDKEADQIVLVVHWMGGRHSEIRVPRYRSVPNSRVADPSTVEIIRQMAGRWKDRQIASTLNRLGRKTGAGNPWNTARVGSARQKRGLPGFDGSLAASSVTPREAARQLGVSRTVVRVLIRNGVLPASQCVACAPWEISVEDLQSEPVQQAILRVRSGGSSPCPASLDSQSPVIPGL